MLSFVQLDKPHIDIELYGTDTNIAPIDKVHTKTKEVPLDKSFLDYIKSFDFTIIKTSKSMLDSKLHCIGNSERKGVCHMLVNDNKLRWVNEE